MASTNIQNIFNNYLLGNFQSATEVSTGYANVNYKVSSSKGKYLLRFHLQHGAEDVNFEMDILDALRSVKYPTAYPYKNIDGNYITQHEEKLIVVYDFIGGNTPDLNVETSAQIAVAVAKLNNYPNWSEFERENVINLKKCHDLIDQFESSNVKYPELFRYFEEQTSFLEPFITKPLPKGLVHGDLFPDNTIFSGNRLQAVIDFEEVCIDHLLMDVGMTINGFCFLDNKLDDDLLKAFLKSYQKIRLLSKDEIELLPHYIQWGAHGMLSWHLTQLLERTNSKQLARAWELANRVIQLRKSNLAVGSIV